MNADHFDHGPKATILTLNALFRKNEIKLFEHKLFNFNLKHKLMNDNNTYAGYHVPTTTTLEEAHSTNRCTPCKDTRPLSLTFAYEITSYFSKLENASLMLEIG